MNKKILYTFFIIFSIFICLSLSQTEAQAITYKPGDILITNSTSSKGIAGHSAIAINSKEVIHTSGRSRPKSELYPKVMTIKDWKSKYKNKVKVVRPNSSTLGKKAAKNAVKYFKNKKIPYSIKTPLTSTKKTYCSQLVWYSYYKSGKTFKTHTIINKEIFSHTIWSTPSFIEPYEFTNKAELDYNGFKMIDNKF